MWFHNPVTCRLAREAWLCAGARNETPQVGRGDLRFSIAAIRQLLLP